MAERVINFDEIIEKLHPTPERVPNHYLAPQGTFRMSVIGPSGAGKTNILVNMLLNMVYYDHIFLYAKDIEEQKYAFLIEFYEELRQKLEAKNIKKLEKKLTKEHKNWQLFVTNDELEACKVPPILTVGTTTADIIDIDTLDPSKQYIMIFDDFITVKDKSKIEEVFIRGRKKGISVIYLSQSYFAIPKVIRLQSNYFIITNIENKREMTQIAQDHTGLSHQEFLKVYELCTNEPYSFLLIDKKTRLKQMRFRSNFNKFVLID